MFHHYLTQREVAGRFGPSQADYDAVLSYLRTNGFELVRGSINHLTITVKGSFAAAERAFALHFGDYRLGHKQFYANNLDPALPPGLASHVQAISGLSNFAAPKPTHIAIISAVCAVEVNLFANFGGWDPNTAQGKLCILKALAWCINWNAEAAGYGEPLSGAGAFPLSPCILPAPEVAGNQLFTRADSAPAPLQGVDGTGQTIGLAEFDNFQPADVSNFLALTGLPASNIGNVSRTDVDGGAAFGANQDEVLLDIDTVMTIAPGAKVVVYDAPFGVPGTSFQAVFNQMLDDGVSIISNSWAYCEDQTTASDAASIDSIFQSAAVSNISVFNGAGDAGSTCLDGSPNTVAVPADSPNATAVGGSSLTLGQGFTHGSETWWNDSSTTPPAGQGGFGVSKFFTAPTYQTGLSGSKMRSVPDVVANADPFHGVQICQGACPSGKSYGGTSMSTPAWAAFTALLNQAQGKNLGFINPLIYPLAKTGAFYNPASMGSDFSHVGLGSPNLDVLASAADWPNRWQR